jgi:hypothetical protein
MGGRVALTIDTPATAQSSIAMFANSTGSIAASGVAYHANSIWTTEEQVRAAPRADGKPAHGW